MAVVLLLLEGATRLHHRLRQGNLHTYAPRHLVDFYRFYRVNPGYSTATIHVNAEGFRDRDDIARAKPADEIRIFVMGGSTVWGENGGDPFPGVISNEQTIAAHLQAALRRIAAPHGDSVRIRVVNAGVVGYLLFQNFTYFNNVIAGYNPDLIVAMDGHNDLDALQVGAPPYTHRNDAALSREMNDPTLFDLYRQALRYAGTKSMLIRKVTVRFSEWVSRKVVAGSLWKDRFTTPPPDSTVQSWLQEYATTVRRFDASGRIADVPVLFTVQLEVAGEHQKPLTDRERAMQEYYAYYGDLHNRLRSRLVTEMTRQATVNGIWFEDITDVLKQERAQAYLDYTHLTGRGAEVVADRLAALIAPSLFCEAGPRNIARCNRANP